MATSVAIKSGHKAKEARILQLCEENRKSSAIEAVSALRHPKQVEGKKDKTILF